MRREYVRVVGAAAADLLPEVVLDPAKIDLGLRDDPQALPLRVVVDAGEIKGVQVRVLGCGLDRPLPPAQPNEVSDFRAARLSS